MRPFSAFLGQVFTRGGHLDDLDERIPLPLRGCARVGGRGRLRQRAQERLQLRAARRIDLASEDHRPILAAGEVQLPLRLRQLPIVWRFPILVKQLEDVACDHPEREAVEFDGLLQQRGLDLVSIRLGCFGERLVDDSQVLLAQ